MFSITHPAPSDGGWAFDDIRVGQTQRERTEEVLGVHILRGEGLSGGADDLMSASTVKWTSLQQAASRLTWLAELASDVVLGVLTPTQAFVRLWDTHDIGEWSSNRALVASLFEAVRTWREQGRFALAASLQSLMLRMGLCVGHDRLVVRSLKELAAIEDANPAAVALVFEPDQLQRLRGAWLSRPGEGCMVGPRPGRFEWMLSQANSLQRSAQQERLLSGLGELILFYSAESSGVALNLRAIGLLPRWAELMLAHNLQRELARFEELLGAVELAAARLLDVGVERSAWTLERTLSSLWELVSERWARRPQLARLAVARARVALRTAAPGPESSVFMSVHRTLSHAYEIAEDSELRAQIRAEWMAAHVQWLSMGESAAEDYASSLLTVVSSSPHNELEGVLGAELYLLLSHNPNRQADYARRAIELSSNVIMDRSEAELEHLPRALMLHGLARLVLAECGDGDASDAMISLRRAQAMLRAQLATHPKGPARLQLASTLIGLARGHLMMADGEASEAQRDTLLTQGAEFCQRARVLAQVADDTLLGCQAVWVLGRLMGARAGAEHLNARHKGLALTLEAMEQLGVAFGAAAVRGIHTVGRTLSDCLIHQYLGLVQLLGRYQTPPASDDR